MLDRDPEYWQQRHSPAEAVQVKLSGERTAQIAKRRIVDARLWDSMSGPHQDASVMIAAGYAALTKGLGTKAASAECKGDAIPGAQPLTDRQLDLIAKLWDWSDEAVREHVDIGAVINVLVFNMTVGQAAKMSRRRKSWVRRNLREGLNIYCKHRGWPQEIDGGN